MTSTMARKQNGGSFEDRHEAREAKESWSSNQTVRRHGCRQDRISPSRKHRHIYSCSKCKLNKKKKKVDLLTNVPQEDHTTLYSHVNHTTET